MDKYKWGEGGRQQDKEKSPKHQQVQGVSLCKEDSSRTLKSRCHPVYQREILNPENKVVVQYTVAWI